MALIDVEGQAEAAIALEVEVEVKEVTGVEAGAKLVPDFQLQAGHGKAMTPGLEAATALLPAVSFNQIVCK
ncbi:hypothetical protein ACHAPA_007667, partial [Fusarium lateritium]